MVRHLLVGLHGLDVDADAGGGGPLDTPLVYGVLTHCNRNIESDTVRPESQITNHTRIKFPRFTL